MSADAGPSWQRSHRATKASKPRRSRFGCRDCFLAPRMSALWQVILQVADSLSDVATRNLTVRFHPSPVILSLRFKTCGAFHRVGTKRCRPPCQPVMLGRASMPERAAVGRRQAPGPQQTKSLAARSGGDEALSGTCPNCREHITGFHFGCYAAMPTIRLSVSDCVWVGVHGSLGRSLLSPAPGAYARRGSAMERSPV
jgi:hypothetical protein